MVNEINKPSKENAALSERLAASNRQLREMQEEHRQLLLEMETLRQRATELSRLNALPLERQQRQQQSLASETNEVPIENVREEVPSSEPTREHSNNVEINATTDTIAHEDTIDDTTTKTVESQPAPAPSSPPLTDSVEDQATTTSLPPASVPVSSENTSENINGQEDEAGAAAYLQEKLAEIARLKSQFKRVQNLIDTTSVIEKHIAAKDATKAELVDSKAALQSQVETVESNAIAPAAVVAAITTPSDRTSNVETTVPSIPHEPSGNATDTADAITEHDENRELLDTMYNLFTDFTSDLRGQAESLRAERDRIKALRDEILSRRQPK